MLKKNKRNLILSTMVILLPVLVGLVLWNRLPEQMPIHWNASGQVDNWGDKLSVVVGLPAFLSVIHLLGLFLTRSDPGNKGHNEKFLGLVFWICPGMSLLVSTVIYCTALGQQISVERIMPILLGAMFVVLGNYMPKFKQNHTMGIRLPWTLADEENWRRTHRLAGPLWVVGGAVMMLNALVESVFPLFFSIVLMVGVPVLYSCLLYKKMHK